MAVDLPERGPLLSPTLSSDRPSPSKSRPLLQRNWSSSSHLPSSLRKKRRLYPLLLALACLASLVLWTLVTSYQHLALRRAQHAARSARTLQGFAESRLANIPDELIPPRRLAESDLLLHPLLTKHSSPLCALNMYQQDRYAPLEPSYGRGINSNQSNLPHFQPRHHLKYMIAINLFNSETVLPTLIRVLHTVLISLDPTRFHLSIYENGSTDDTPALLFLLAQILDRMGTGYTIISDPSRASGWAPKKRIAGLAEVRNAAMAPMYEAPEGTFDRVVFINDVHLCEADLLEILLQHEVQEADMSCGMDYKELKIKEFEAQGYPLLFYDVWVARDMLGLPFYHIKYPTGDWVLPSPVLPHSPSRFRHQNNLPFQVFSCFNGVTVIDASLFLPPHNIRFRADNGSDIHSECYIICSDIWETMAPWDLEGKVNERASGEEGRGARIQVVPRASVGYEVGEYERARQDRNTTSFEKEGWQLEVALEEEMVKWEQWPPRLVQNYPYAYWGSQKEMPPY